MKLFDWYKPWDTYGIEEAIQHAFWIFAILWEEGEYQRTLFEQRWGSANLDVVERVLREGSTQDVCFALSLIAFLSEDDAPEPLIPYLKSQRIKERWTSAMLLAEMKEERAIPVLCEALTEMLPSEDEPWPDDHAIPDEATHDGDGDDWYALKRLLIVRILNFWPEPEVADAFVQALLLHMAAEPWSRTDGYFYFLFQDTVLYELGYRHALDTLKALSLPPPRERLAALHFATGYIDSALSRAQFLQLKQRHPVSRANEAHWKDTEELIYVLEEVLGYNAIEAIEIVGHFPDYTLQRDRTYQMDGHGKQKWESLDWDDDSYWLSVLNKEDM